MGRTEAKSSENSPTNYSKSIDQSGKRRNKKPPRRAADLHGPAGIGALFTFGSTFLAMVVFEFRAACGTLIADCRAQLAELPGMFGIRRHQAGGFFTDSGAFHHLSDMVFSGRYIGLVKAKFDAFMTCL